MFAKFKWKLCLFLVNLFPNKFAVIIFRLAGIKIGRGSLISKTSFFHNGRVTIGGNCYVNKHCKFYTGMNENGIICIGNNVNLGMGVSLICTTHKIGDPIRAGQDISKSIVIEDDCWIGGVLSYCQV